MLALLYVAPLGLNLPLLDPDEGLHAAIALEMVERGDYVTPRFLGEPFLDKPVLYFWAQAASLRLFGANASAIRGVGLAFAALGALVTGWSARRMLGRGAGAVACVVYATMLLPLALGQAAVHDVALLPWIVLASLAFWEARWAPATGPTLAWSVLAGVWLGLALLTKGVVGVAIVGIAVGSWLAWTRGLRWTLVAGGLLSLLVAAAVAAPWYLAMERANPGYLRYFVVERHFLGFTTGSQPHGDRPWWYYVPLVVAGGLPWIGRISASAVGPAGTDRARSARQLSWCWLAGGWAFLSAAGSKLVTYILPVFPPLALLVTASVTATGREPGRPFERWAQLVSAYAMAGVLPALLWIAHAWFGGAVASPAGWGAAAVLAAAWVWAGTMRPRARSFAVVTALTIVTAWGGLLLAAPTVARALSARDLAAAINAHGRFPERLWVFDERVGSLVFYLDAPLRRGLTPARVARVGLDRVAGMRQALPGTLIAVPSEQLARLTRLVDLGGVPYEDAGAHRLYKAEDVVRALRREQP